MFGKNLGPLCGQEDSAAGGSGSSGGSADLAKELEALRAHNSKLLDEKKREAAKAKEASEFAAKLKAEAEAAASELESLRKSKMSDEERKTAEHKALAEKAAKEASELAAVRAEFRALKLQNQALANGVCGEEASEFVAYKLSKLESQEGFDPQKFFAGLRESAPWFFQVQQKKEEKREETEQEEAKEQPTPPPLAAAGGPQTRGNMSAAQKAVEISKIKEAMANPALNRNQKAALAVRLQEMEMKRL